MTVLGPRGVTVAGVVLAGGQSRRMGRTKALVEVGGRAMAERVLDAMHAGGCAPLALVGGDADELSTVSAPVWPDAHPGAGPVGGVTEALRRCAQDPTVEVDAVMVAACDLPWLHPSLVEQLITGLLRAPAADVCVARSDRIEPLCAVWRLTAEDQVGRAFGDGVRAMHELLERVRAVAVDVDPEVVRNINAPHDLP